MIRHANFGLAAAIPLLAIAMVELPFQALLMSAVGTTPLVEPCMPLTGETTVAMAAITADA